MHPLADHWINEVVLQSPVARALGITLHAARVDCLSAGLPFSEDLTTVPGVLHGGVIASFIDTLGAAASATGVTPDLEISGGATTHLVVAYLAPATSDLTGTATVVHRSASGTLTDVQVRDVHGTLVATGQVSNRFTRSPRAVESARHVGREI